MLSSDGQGKNETSILENLPPYAEIHAASLAKHGDRDHAEDALRKQLHRDVEALAGAGISVEVEGTQEGRLYRLPPTGYSPVEVFLSDEERAVLVGALRALRRDFPYAGPLRLALANLIGAASAGTLQGGYEDEEDRVTLAAVATRDDEAVAARVATLERSVSRRKRVRFDYYSISRDATSTREVEPYTLSLLDCSWYLNAYCRRVDGSRLFRLDRILAATLTGEHFEDRKNLELKTDYEDIDPRTYAARRAVVRFSPAVARWMEERPELDLIEEREDDSADYALYYTDPVWAARRVMQYLGEAVVVEPEELRQEVHQQAGSLLRNYEKE